MPNVRFARWPWCEVPPTSFPALADDGVPDQARTGSFDFLSQPDTQPMPQYLLGVTEQSRFAIAARTRRRRAR